MKALFPFAEETRGVTVRVSVSYLPEQSQPGSARWFWAYHIRVENDGEMAVQLMTRHWIISDGRGEKHEVQGDGVVGEQPVILPGASYDYVSGCPLPTPSGSMVGSFGMIGEDGSRFDIGVPRFELLTPVTTR
ncbi:Co2+/Mg2+ efflux protein ApaG [Sphingomonas paeninsulae]|jgi:ApaG protein|uniref:Protein ApaG n=1 Tax=Sphingomonas paeninsulae TaxID=2319844 RepID=A0A494TCJ8_SPHPE|nr:Co2+/Mg2+ efflux protein ApaG [Sphingomonas paeninsulae]AYJ87209.1 Co2+/Mg2+ efflux protein ApaG [Sphingomonas paeninsulae]